MSNTIKKISAIGLSLTTAVWLSGAAMVLPVAQGATVAELQAQIAALLSQIQSLQTQLGSTSGSSVSVPSITRDLTVGSTGADVKSFQVFLNAQGYTVASTGAGSPGNETTTFGSLTKAAVAKFQAAKGISPAAGYFGKISRAYLSSMATTGGTTGGTTTGGTTTGGVVPSGNALAVAIATDSPSARTIGSGTAFNPALKVMLTAGSAAVKVNSILLQKSGFLSNTNLNGVEVIASNGVRHGNVVTSVSADNTVLLTMSVDPITVAAGSTETITIKFNLLTGNYTGTVGFGIGAASAITTDGATVSGSFPINGSISSIVNGGTSLASTTLDVQTSTGSSTLNVNTTDLQEVTKFRIQEVSSNEGVKLYKLTLYNYGSGADTDVKDVTLVAQDGTTLAVAQQAGKWVTFDLSSNPYLIDKGLTRDFTVKAKLIDGASRTINYVVYNNYDVDLRGVSTGVSVLPGNGTVDASFPVGNGSNIQTIGSGSITMNRASDSPSTAVVPGATSVVLAKYTVRPTGENYELRQVKFYIATSTNAAAVDLTGTVYVKVNGSTVMSQGIADISNTTATAESLSSWPILTAGQDSIITVEGAVNSAATAVSTYQVKSFQLSQAKRITTNDIISNPSSAVDGNVIAVKAAVLAITTLSTPVANSVVKGTNSYEYATVQLNAQSGGEDVRISKLVFTHNGSSTVDSDISTYYLYKDSDTSPLTTSAATTDIDGTADGSDDLLTFNFTTPITVTRATAVTLHLKGNVLSAATTGSASRFNIATSTTAFTAVGVSTGNSLTNADVTFAGSGQTQTVVAAGKITLSLATGGPSANQIVNVGTTDVTVFAFKLTSQYEAQKVTSLKLTATSSGSTGLATTTLKNIRLFETVPSGTPIATAAQFDACSISQCTVTFTATDNILSAAVPTTGTTLYVKADVGAGGIARLGDNFKFQITSSTDDVAVKGAVTASTAGTVTGTPTQGGSTYITPFNTVVTGNWPTAAATVGTGAGTIGIFKITNNGGAQIHLASTTAFGNFILGGSNSTSSFALYASIDGGSSADSSVTYTATSTATAASSTVPFDLTYVAAADRLINSQSWRYLNIQTSSSSTSGDSYRLGVTLGDLTYQVAESDLGYDGNLDGDLTDTIVGLYVDGTPTLETVTKSSSI